MGRNSVAGCIVLALVLVGCAAAYRQHVLTLTPGGRDYAAGSGALGLDPVHVAQAAPRAEMFRLLDELRARVTRPVPVLPQRNLPRRPEMIWVPDRWILRPGEPDLARIPAHWERRITEREFHVPPLLIFHPDGRLSVAPGGVQGPVERRVGW